MSYWTVPRLWPGETVVCIGSGPSLLPEDVDYCQGRARVIALNNVYQLAPWADLLYATGWYANGPSWWTYHMDALSSFDGLKVTMDTDMAPYDVKIVRRGDVTGLSLDRTTLNHGWNSGYAAINLAVHLGVARVLLLGYDMQPAPNYRHHWHPDHPKQVRPPYIDWLLAFESLPKPLRNAGVEVLNCTRVTALTTFPRVPLDEALRAAPG